ncbi:slr1658 superfamily regulator [Lusitaniella coriacea]|uniref:slr1658 superfamily regulator n=1 Tax=Lusitaniella coriacea TaxID=1983105 RepID=UPI003CFBAC9A
MTEFQVFGDFQEKLQGHSHEFLILGISDNSMTTQKQWQKNGLSADFVAAYLATFLPLKQEELENKKLRKRIQESVNYIANELLENAMKFNDRKFPHPIKFELHLLKDENLKIFMKTKNNISYETLEHFRTFIKDFISSDPDEFYLRQLERTDDEYTSGLGFISIKNDYFAKLGWKFEKIEQEPLAIAATTMVQLEYGSYGSSNL